jgi:TPP-dependent indolepyruvate ferredoxin oxidoreductase alpha subunit
MKKTIKTVLIKIGLWLSFLGGLFFTLFKVLTNSQKTAKDLTEKQEKTELVIKEYKDIIDSKKQIILQKEWNDRKEKEVLDKKLEAILKEEVKAKIKELKNSKSEREKQESKFWR